jgi:uncharacterized RmlC-like cupin family protein
MSAQVNEEENMAQPEVRRVPQRASVQSVYQNVVRFKEVTPNWEAYPEAVLPAYQRALYRYIGTAGGVDDRIPATVTNGDVSFALAYADPGRGAPLHDHTAQEIFFALTSSWKIYFGDEGEEHVILEPWDAVLVPRGMQRGFANAGNQPGYLMAIITRGDEPFPDYSESVLEALEKVRPQ